MLEFLLEIDRELFLYLNSLHTPWLDTVMVFITDKLVWLPLYIFLLYLIIRDFGLRSWAVLVGIVLTIVIADQATSSLMKPYFARLRPSHDPSIQNLVHIVGGYRGGQYGFASSHAANTFGIAAFLFLLLGKRRKWIALLFPWAALVTYSRIYLGVHYPGDILIGGLVGMVAALIGFQCYQWLKQIDLKRKKSSPGASH